MEGFFNLLSKYNKNKYIEVASEWLYSLEIGTSGGLFDKGANDPEKILDLSFFNLVNSKLFLSL